MFDKYGEGRPYLIAEIGGNHEGDFQDAKALVSLACSSGADAVKLQIYRGDSLVSRIESPQRNAHFKKFELTPSEHIYLAQMCAEQNVVYAASVWDLESLNWIDDYLTFYKIGSGDLTAYPILDTLAERGKPIVLSTGLSTLDEVGQAIDRIRRKNKIYLKPGHLCVLQCTSMYPIPLQEAQISTMDSFRREFGVTVGYSDHTEGLFACELAAGMGANALEFHFTDDRLNRSFRDHLVSLLHGEVVDLVAKFSRFKSAWGNGEKVPQPSEISNNHLESFRRGVYLNRDVKHGDILELRDLVFLRPAIGTDARFYESMIGAKVLKPIKAYAAVYRDIDYSPQLGLHD